MLGGALALLAVGYASRATWLPAMSRTLTCEANDANSEAVLVDLVEYHGALFDRAKELQQRAGAGSAVIVPVLRTSPADRNYAVALGFVDVMCRAAGIATCETFPVDLVEPYSLNVARASAAELKRRGVGSVSVVTGGFRSRRAAGLYGSVLKGAGIEMRCQPVFLYRGPDDWYKSAHGVQEMVLQTGKLIYYAIFVR